MFQKSSIAKHGASASAVPRSGTAIFITCLIPVILPSELAIMVGVCRERICSGNEENQCTKEDCDGECNRSYHPNSGFRQVLSRNSNERSFFVHLVFLLSAKTRHQHSDFFRGCSCVHKTRYFTGAKNENLIAKLGAEASRSSPTKITATPFIFCSVINCKSCMMY